MNWRAFFHGVGSILDLSGQSGGYERRRHRLSRLQARPLTEAEAWALDAQAVASDWEAVGNDLSNAWQKVKSRH